MLKTFFRISFLVALLVFCYGSIFSQVGPPPDPGGDPDIPITGIEWLLIGGGLWGAKKIYDEKKKKK